MREIEGIHVSETRGTRSGPAAVTGNESHITTGEAAETVRTV